MRCLKYNQWKQTYKSAEIQKPGSDFRDGLFSLPEGKESLKEGTHDSKQLHWRYNPNHAKTASIVRGYWGLVTRKSISQLFVLIWPYIAHKHLESGEEDSSYNEQSQTTGI